MNTTQPDRYSVYELPLNNAIRILMRYENLTAELKQRLSAGTDIIVLHTLYQILELLQNNDMSRMLIKRLTRQIECLKQFSHHKKANQAQLSNIIASHKQIIQETHQSPIGNIDYRNHYFLSSVFRHLALPCGTCAFDLPQLYVWRQNSKKKRMDMLKQWAAPFVDFSHGVCQCLNLTRKSGDYQKCVASRGYFSADLGKINEHIEMLRVEINSKLHIYPEISANRQLLTMHFLELEKAERQPTEIKDDVNFRLAYCTL